ncbi:MAG: permease-like cell division protein FtsX, partial [Acidobacteria bacterium]|nr:permease-like cell division protein FtsX [Acidobacteriota bacterium]
LASLLSVLAMAVAIFLVASFWSLSHGIRGTWERLAEQSVVEVYVKDGADEAEVAALAEAVKRAGGVRRVERVTPERALAEFRALYPDLGDVRDLLGGNPFPGSLRIQPEGADPARIGKLVEVAKASPVTDSVRYDRDWLVALSRLGGGLSRFALAGAAALLLAALVTIGSVVRLALDDKREEVALLRIVGAPNAVVVGPVLTTGALLGAAGALAGVLGASLARQVAYGSAATSPLAGLTDVLFEQGLSTLESLALIGFGAAAGALAAGVAAGRRGWTG